MAFKHTLASAALITAITTLSGCGSGVPGCGDQETKDLVSSIADREFAKQMGAEAAQLIKWKVIAIRTTDENEKTGAFECAANLEVSGPGGTHEAPITYTVEKTDDGDFYVNVFGL
ncbi:hypothetical protein KXR63_04895 [Stutzerimonas chloritidismutans]|uniref:hypothetical protein n=1 Tax=Stutzerimonas TaxID=2901164 RepID=UPI0028A9F191|nr:MULTISPECIES: hypothetical protein [Stutzerimonas]